MDKLKLTIELLPKGAWRNDLSITLPKKDYIESASEKVKINEEDNKNWFEKIIDAILNRN